MVPSFLCRPAQEQQQQDVVLLLGPLCVNLGEAVSAANSLSCEGGEGRPEMTMSGTAKDAVGHGEGRPAPGWRRGGEPVG